MDTSYVEVGFLAPPQRADYLFEATGWVTNTSANQVLECELVEHSVISNVNTILQYVEADSFTSETGSTSFALSATASLPNLSNVQVLCRSSKGALTAVDLLNLSAVPVTVVN